MRRVNEDNMANYLAHDCREIEEEIVLLSKKHNIAGVLQAVVNFLRTLLLNNRLTDACMHIRFLGQVYQKGNKYVRYLIENLVVRAFESFRRQCDQQQWEQLYGRIPYQLQGVYQQQVIENQIQKSRL